MLLPQSGSEYDLPCEHRFGPFWHRFWKDQGSILKIFASFFELPGLAYFGHFFGCSCSPRSWLGFRWSWPSPQPICQGNPRTCRGQSREQIRTDDYKKYQTSQLSSSKLPSKSQTSRLQKRRAAVLPPGGLQSARPPW